mgnify:CR=1 FL=1
MAENMGFLISFNTTNNANQVGQQSNSESPDCQAWSLYPTSLAPSDYYLFNPSVLKTNKAESQFIDKSH